MTAVERVYKIFFDKIIVACWFSFVVVSPVFQSKRRVRDGGGGGGQGRVSAATGIRKGNELVSCIHAHMWSGRFRRRSLCCGRLVKSVGLTFGENVCRL